MKRLLSMVLVGLSLGASSVHAESTINEVEAPQAHGPVPSAGQMKYYKEELAAFMHFGMNTFTGKEWGNGQEDPALFNPTALDAEQWVKVFDEIGFGRLIMVGKHHDGFNIWPSQYTEHSVKNSPWRNGEGDLLEEVSRAATKYDMNMGFYLSPWDAHEPSYGVGNPGDYNEFYQNQLHEVLGNEKYGNNGVFDEVWMDGAKGSGAADQDYNFDEWFDIIKSYNEDTVIFSPYGTEVRWIGNENGIAGEPSWQRVDAQRLRDRYDQGLGENNNYLNHGQADGPDWSIGEADVSIRSGWFHHEHQQPKSLQQLMDIYFKSVGRGAPLLLNVPADKRGLLDDADIERLREFRSALDGTFTVDYAEGSSVTASQSRGNGYEATNVIDRDYDSYWTMNDEETEGSLLLDLGETRLIDVIEIQEYIPLGQRIAGFNVEVHSNGKWHEFASGETIGYKRLVRGNPVRADKVRINITNSQAVPLINNVGIYKADESIELDTGVPLGMDSIDNTKFDTTGAWNPETGIGMNDTSMWTTQKNATASFEFTGSKFYLTTTQDPSHGKMEVKIDDEIVEVVDTYAPQRTAGNIAYESPDLLHGNHKVEIRVLGEKNAQSRGVAVGLDGVYYLDNNGRGMFELSLEEGAVDEGEPVKFKIDRVAGSKGEVEVTFQTAPGTGVHGRNYIDKTKVLTFKDGETTKTVTVETIDNNEIMGDVFFFGELVSPTNEAITGFNSRRRATIIENDYPVEKDALKASIDLANKKEQQDYTEKSWDHFIQVKNEAIAIYDSEEVTQSEVDQVTQKLNDAMDKLLPQHMITKDNPLKIILDQEVSVEAEHLVLHGDAQVETRANASNNEVVGWIGSGANYDGSLELWLDILEPGTYEIDIHYFLGAPNQIKWSNEQENNKIEGAINLPFDGQSPGKFDMRTITINTAETGLERLLFFNDEGDGPNIDKFVIRFVEPEVDTSELTALIEEAKNISTAGMVEESVEKLNDAIKASEDLLKQMELTQTEIDKQVTALQKAIDNLEEIEQPEAEAKRAAVLVDRMIYRLPNVRVLTVEDTPLVVAARSAYEDLSDQAKMNVRYLGNLELREDRLEILNSEEEVADEFAVRELQRRIYRLPSARNITLADSAQVAAVRAEYEALNDASKAEFSAQYLKNLEAREAKLTELSN